MKKLLILLPILLLAACHGETHKITCYTDNGTVYFSRENVHVDTSSGGTSYVYKNDVYVNAVSGNCVVSTYVEK